MKHLLMLDSGAFSVWNKGATVDLDKYIEFCLRYPEVSYYVNLDVIPGSPNQKRTLTRKNIQRACNSGWENYKRMLSAGIPKNKIIPVFHQNDGIYWLEKYLDYGTPYLGISPANDNVTEIKSAWMRTLKPYLFDKAGRPVVKTHGFAVTSYWLMNFWEWYSVDSASWKLTAAWGGIYLPQRTNGEWDYSKVPNTIAVTPQSPLAKKRGCHISSCSPLVKRQILDYLKECGTCLGEGSIRKEKREYKLDRAAGELWFDKKKGIVMEEVERGVATRLEERCAINARFMRLANKVLPVKHIYLAGAPMPYPLEFEIRKRLLSFYEIGKAKDGKTNKYLKGHLKAIKECSQ